MHIDIGMEVLVSSWFGRFFPIQLDEVGSSWFGLEVELFVWKDGFWADPCRRFLGEVELIWRS